MGGRRRDFDGQYAMVDIGFILSDPRCLSMSAKICLDKRGGGA